MIDFEIPEDAKAIREKVRTFVQEHCIPAEKELDTRPYKEVLADLRAKARSQGLWCPFIPKEYGGKGFSAFAHSQVITRLSTRSSAPAVTVMVPNSLGPAELLLHYGTPEQKAHYLPRLAAGLEIPAFALTSPWAGSDAASIPDAGVVCRFERGSNLPGDRHGGFDRHAAARDHLRQRHAVDQLHHQRVHTIAILEAVDRGDVGMLERRERPCFANESRDAIGIRIGFRRQDLDRHVSLEARVARPIHHAHAARTEPGLDLIRADLTADHRIEAALVLMQAHLIEPHLRPRTGQTAKKVGVRFLPMKRALLTLAVLLTPPASAFLRPGR